MASLGFFAADPGLASFCFRFFPGTRRRELGLLRSSQVTRYSGIVSKFFTVLDVRWAIRSRDISHFFFFFFCGFRIRGKKHRFRFRYSKEEARDKRLRDERAKKLACFENASQEAVDVRISSHHAWIYVTNRTTATRRMLRRTSSSIVHNRIL